VFAVRGKLTRQILGLPETVPLGDPGLLLRKYYRERQKKKFVLGLIPHNVDKNNRYIAEMVQREPAKVKVINVSDCRRGHLFGDGVWNVVRQIDECEHIVSSSLHGLIISDMLNIPNRQMLLSNKVVGGGFKFRDYYSAFDTERSPLVLDGTETAAMLVNSTLLPPSSLPEVTDTLEEAWNKMLNVLLR
jgi:pyruvyltransferase